MEYVSCIVVRNLKDINEINLFSAIMYGWDTSTVNTYPINYNFNIKKPTISPRNLPSFNPPISLDLPTKYANIASISCRNILSISPTLFKLNPSNIPAITTSNYATILLSYASSIASTTAVITPTDNATKLLTIETTYYPSNIATIYPTNISSITPTKSHIIQPIILLTSQSNGHLHSPTYQPTNISSIKLISSTNPTLNR